ncbi:MAG TPA: aminotransferase class I/II-fold pyridoxal phosphate-dependent enzyme [Ktedonobacteraceae bacterium]|nr:aminotransferase class I/II-fold pyridoxal phosphate-dependent enzyme [Ktedonobacteraceae bacterium]
MPPWPETPWQGMTARREQHLPMHRLALDAEHFKRVGQHVLEQARTFLYDERPIYQPLSREERERWQQAPLPAQGLDPAHLLSELQEVSQHATFGINHRRSYAYVGGGVNEWGVLASLLAAALNPNCIGGDQAITYMELATIRWLAELSGFALPPHGGGVLTTGSSQATLLALAAARQRLARRLGRDMRVHGLQGLSPLAIYVSDQTHASVHQQANVLGLGRVCVIASDDEGRMRLDVLQETMERDERLGILPCCVVATVGTTNTGAIDPLEALAEVCERHHLGLHVDGAYGGLGWVDERLRERYRGIERAHSLSLDGHKWLGVPYESGCLLVREQQALKEAFARPTPSYLKQVEDEHPHFSDLSAQVSRAPRALVLWAVLRSLGYAGVRSLVMRHRDLATLLAAGLVHLPGMRLLAPVELSTVCFRYEPAWAQGDEEHIRTCNQHLLRDLESTAFLSTTELHGQWALRACVLHPRTDWDDIRLFLDALPPALARQEAGKP